MSLNLLSAAYEGVELGIGDHILMKAIAQATGRSVDKLKKQMEEVGDLGSIAENSKECSRFLLVSLLVVGMSLPDFEVNRFILWSLECTLIE